MTDGGAAAHIAPAAATNATYRPGTDPDFNP
jgi:hypothetical protein